MAVETYKSIICGIFPPRRGDIIYVDRELYRHYGIYAGNNKVIHFAACGDSEIKGENAVVHETTLPEFLKGGKARIDHDSESVFSRKETVERAYACIGQKGYNLVFNNCENFARWCKTGISRSTQVEKAVVGIVDTISKIFN
ncbi:hypothetical protein AGMMS50293_29660 [Spirochaetia bacterium]|nr:hypothetical protein AGMMS50293_29660 [Spirochaetia bacterium]